MYHLVVRAVYICVDVVIAFLVFLMARKRRGYLSEVSSLVKSFLLVYSTARIDIVFSEYSFRIKWPESQVNRRLRG